jgi:hypothetical protein
MPRAANTLRAFAAFCLRTQQSGQGSTQHRADPVG